MTIETKEIYLKFFEKNCMNYLPKVEVLEKMKMVNNSYRMIVQMMKVKETK
jgi:hypothetical protein